jgi:hypothetical protein
MNERIKELAEQAGFEVVKTNDGFAIWTDEGWNTDSLERFAELVRQDEREKCAKLCEDINKTFGVGFIVVDHCAAAIRGRTE